nr:gag pol polyprotein [Hymenolepis microstoma]
MKIRCPGCTKWRRYFKLRPEISDLTGFPDGAEKAVARTPRSQTPAENNYGHIWEEALAVVYTLKKFHEVVYGRHFTFQTDHKP